MSEMRVVKKLNAHHSEVVKSKNFQLGLSRLEREKILEEHKHNLFTKKSLLTRLLLLSSSDLNADLNADIDDVLDSWDMGKRLNRRLRKAYYIGLAKVFLKDFKENPLEVFGSAATKELHSITFVP